MHKKPAYIITGSLVAIFLIFMIPSTTTYEREPKSTEDEATGITDTQIVTLRPELVPICSCESMQGKNGTPTHYEADGVTVLRGRVNQNDIGICQINLDYHEKAAISAGLDLFIEADNITYANLLYEQQGNQPWSWSKQCWTE